MFGIPQRQLREEFIDEQVRLANGTTGSFIELVTEFVKGWKQSWLDVTGHELDLHQFGPWPLVPTVVLVGSPVADLSLFWNLRAASDTTRPAWIIPIPVEGSTDCVVLEQLKAWLLAFLPYGPRPSFCQVTSQSVPEETCRAFAAAFGKALGDKPIETVDYAPPRNRLPVVLPYEYETTWSVDVAGRRLTIQPPKPKAFEEIGSPRSWFVDLVKDVKTRRAVRELQLPPSTVVFELLNGPCPPGFEHCAVPMTGDGHDCINARCSGSKEVINIFLPTPRQHPPVRLPPTVPSASPRSLPNAGRGCAPAARPYLAYSLLAWVARQSGRSQDTRYTMGRHDSAVLLELAAGRHYAQ
jgi:hypothetical protein